MPKIIIDQTERYPEFEISPIGSSISRSSVTVSVSAKRLKKWKDAIAAFEGVQKEMRGVVKKTLGGVEIKAEANPRDLPPIPPPRKPFVRDDNSGLPPLNKENPHPPIKEGPSVPYAGFSPKEVRELKKLRKTPLTPRTGK